MKAVFVISAAMVAMASAAFSFNGEVATTEPIAEGDDASIVEASAAPEPVIWERPDGPLRVALQAGHWKAAEAPDEQSGLRTNGTRGGGKAEWEVNLEIARRTAALLEGKGYVVDILPTTIPPGYLADLFVAIHADGSTSPSASGFRAAAPRRDMTGRAAAFANLLEERYGLATGLRRYPTVTRRMTGYYAFNHRRYEHALHPMTVGVIIETGFLTSPSDRRVIVSGQDRAARGIAEAINLYMQTTALEPRTVAVVSQDPPRGRGRVEGLRSPGRDLNGPFAERLESAGGSGPEPRVLD